MSIIVVARESFQLLAVPCFEIDKDVTVEGWLYLYRTFGRAEIRFLIDEVGQPLEPSGL
jgi:hypothetical protein